MAQAWPGLLAAHRCFCTGWTRYPLVIEVDRLTGFSEEFTHAGGAQPRNPELRRNLYAALITNACNLGYAGMADASGISEDALAWTSQWYLRQETLRAANTTPGLVNAHHAVR